MFSWCLPFLQFLGAPSSTLGLQNSSEENSIYSCVGLEMRLKVSQEEEETSI